MITLKINNTSVTVDDGTTVAAAIMSLGITNFKRSLTGEARGPLCGMGICFECRVTIDGVRFQRSCNTLATSGMEVVADDQA